LISADVGQDKLKRIHKLEEASSGGIIIFSSKDFK
jgi:hypothetical protein